MDIQREIGVLEEQGRWLAREVSEIKTDVKSLLESRVLTKGKQMGAIAVVTLISSVIFQLLLAAFKEL